ncbi:MAG TPA: hypothetical protein VJ724_08180, partial [Tahibacter sp.]|nr:hypothetical protein [Tahibacter sp.]
MLRLLAFLAACLCVAAQAADARLPHTFTVAQRTTTSLAPAGVALALTVGDVTGGQVLAHVATRDGVNVFGPRSMRVGDAGTFDATGRRFTLR